MSEPAGLVTNADLYRELTGMRRDIGEALIRLERVDTVVQGEMLVRSDHEARIRALEAFRWKLAGACIVLSAIAGAAASFIHH